MNKEQLERLFREWRDDAAQRQLNEKGVRYEDVPEHLRDALEGKGQEATKDVQDRGMER